MFKVIAAIILLLFVVQADFAYAQSQGDWSSKIYSGDLYQNNGRGQGSWWHSLFGKKNSQPTTGSQDSQCSIEFRSPVPFTHQLIADVPEELTYFIRFKNSTLGKFFIKIHSNDDQDFTIDPEAEGKQVGVNDEHRIFDSYLIYLILGQDISYIEVVSAYGEDKGKYILDKVEIHNDD